MIFFDSGLNGVAEPFLVSISFVAIQLIEDLKRHVRQEGWLCATQVLWTQGSLISQQDCLDDDWSLHSCGFRSKSVRRSNKVSKKSSYSSPRATHFPVMLDFEYEVIHHSLRHVDLTINE